MGLKHEIATCYHHWPFSSQTPISANRVWYKDGCIPGGGGLLNRLGVSCDSHRSTGQKAREPLATLVVWQPGEESEFGGPCISTSAFWKGNCSATDLGIYTVAAARSEYPSPYSRSLEHSTQEDDSLLQWVAESPSMEIIWNIQISCFLVCFFSVKSLGLSRDLYPKVNLVVLLVECLSGFSFVLIPGVVHHLPLNSLYASAMKKTDLS